jgi:AsmA-like C-terminal region
MAEQSMAEACNDKDIAASGTDGLRFPLDLGRFPVGRMRKWIVVAAGLLLCLSVAVAGFAPLLHSLARERTKAFLQARFASEVQFSDFRVSFFPRVRLTAIGIVMRHSARTDLPPLLKIQRLSASASLLGFFKSPARIESVRLDGLQIHLPPRGRGGKALNFRFDEQLAKKYPVVVQKIRADEALLVILRAQPGKPSEDFLIHQFELLNFDFDHATFFRATLTNPVPTGEIEAAGEFGPWQAEQPSLTHVAAHYTLKNANLGTLHGIAGTLSSQGKFSGPLDYLAVDGETDTPNFRLRLSSHPVPLSTEFKAIVDGTNGNTILKNVAARFLHSSVDASGEVLKAENRGRRILVNAVMDDGRVEDLLWLAVNQEPAAMTGTTQLRAKLEIPPGSTDLIDRLKLDGRFGVGAARFTNPTVQQKVEKLSRKGQGHPKETASATGLSRLRGNFKLRGGVVTFSRLSFDVAGASLQLRGNYNLDSGKLDFHGKLLLRARLSHTTTGVKSLLLKPLDPLFKGQNVGTVLPIKITGTKDKPSFKLDLGGGSKER